MAGVLRSAIAATLGTHGTEPKVRAAVYRAGYLFSRTGWGVGRRAARQRSMSLRFGPADATHAHADAGSLTLYSYGDRLLANPGMWAHEPGDARRRWALSRAAHNVVIVAGRRARPEVQPRLVRARLGRRVTDTTLDLPLVKGVSMRRRVLFSTREGYLVVEDTIRSRRPVTTRQLWHLLRGSAPRTVGPRTWTRGPGGNVLVWQLRSPGSSDLVTGPGSPIAGWLGDSYRTFVPAPVLQRRAHGRVIRYLTLVAPVRTDRPLVSVRGLRAGTHGFSMTIEIDGRQEHVRATAHGATITDG